MSSCSFRRFLGSLECSENVFSVIATSESLYVHFVYNVVPSVVEATQDAALHDEALKIFTQVFF